MASKYRIVEVKEPGNSPAYFIVEEYVEQEAPNGDYWSSYPILKAPSAKAAKEALIKSLTMRKIVEEITL